MNSTIIISTEYNRKTGKIHAHWLCYYLADRIGFITATGSINMSEQYTQDELCNMVASDVVSITGNEFQLITFQII